MLLLGYYQPAFISTAYVIGVIQNKPDGCPEQYQSTLLHQPACKPNEPKKQA